MKVRFYVGKCPRESFLFEQEVNFIPQRKDIVWYESEEAFGEPYEVKEVNYFFDGKNEEAIEIFVAPCEDKWED